MHSMPAGNNHDQRKSFASGQLRQRIAAGDIAVVLHFAVARPRRVFSPGNPDCSGFMVPATLTAHAFWSATPDMHSAQLTNFLKNTAIVGSLLTVAGYFAQLAERFGSKGTAKGEVGARANA